MQLLESLISYQKQKSDRPSLCKILCSTTFVWDFFRYLLLFSRYKGKTVSGVVF